MITFHLFNLFKLCFFVFLGAKDQIPPVAVSKQDPGVFFFGTAVEARSCGMITFLKYPRCLWRFLQQARFRPRFGSWKWMKRIDSPESNSLHLKMDAWNTSFLFGMPYFSGAMLVLGRVAFPSLGPLGSLASLTHQDPSSGCNLELGPALLWWRGRCLQAKLFSKLGTLFWFISLKELGPSIRPSVHIIL